MSNYRLLGSKYILIKKIASGGMAEVYLAKQLGFEGFEKLVVIKCILPSFSRDRDYVQMFLDEAKTAADLQHSNLINTFEFGEDNGIYYMVMEYLHGHDLKMIFSRSVALVIPIPMSICVGIIADAALGIHYAHTKKNIDGLELGIVHRDISPQNIVATFDGSIKIIDFGVAKALNHTCETVVGILKGKYGYLSPEQAIGGSIDARSDQFSLGIILYELTTMRRLFQYENELQTINAITECHIAPPTTVIKDYPIELEVVVMRALSKDPEKRFANCQIFRQALEDVLNILPVPFSPLQLGHYMRDIFKEEPKSEEVVLELPRPRANLWHTLNLQLTAVAILGCVFGFVLVAALAKIFPTPLSASTGLSVERQCTVKKKTVARNLPVKIWGKLLTERRVENTSE